MAGSATVGSRVDPIVPYCLRQQEGGTHGWEPALLVGIPAVGMSLVPAACGMQPGSRAPPAVGLSLWSHGMLL